MPRADAAIFPKNAQARTSVRAILQFKVPKCASLHVSKAILNPPYRQRPAHQPLDTLSFLLYPLSFVRRRGARVVESGSLENCCTFTGTVGSNPTLSATLFSIRDSCFQLLKFFFQADADRLLLIAYSLSPRFLERCRSG